MGYGYDTEGRLISATEKTTTGVTSASWSYTYDNNGNRLAAGRAGATGVGSNTDTWTYNAANQVTSYNGSSANLGYDANGNELANPGNVGLTVPRRTVAYSPVTRWAPWPLQTRAGNRCG